MAADRLPVAGNGILRLLVVFWVSVGSLALAGLAHSDALLDEDCLACHAERTLARSGRRATTSAFVDTTTLRGSVHSALRCLQCHPGVNAIPHADRLPAVRCGACHAAVADTLEASVHGAGRAQGCAGCHGTHAIHSASRLGMGSCRSCHAQVSDEYRSSVHGRALARGDGDASTCRGCHGPVHAIRPHLDPASSTNRARLAGTCAACHADRTLMTRRKITIPEAVQLFRASVHGRSSDPKAATCNDCHESHRLLRATDPASSIHRANIATTCGRCHEREAHDYRISIHGVAMARGVTASPACIDCHGEHLVRGPAEAGSPVGAAGISRTCSRCHEAEGIRETYGLPAGRLSTWQDSFHGLAARGGSPAVAHCASCHGYHAILPSSDPRSDISPKNLARTCGRCHPGAGEKFAAGAVHVAMARPEHPVLLWVRRIYLGLIGLTIGGMLLHNGLDFAKKFAAHVRRNMGSSAGSRVSASVERWVVRMTPGERIQHALLLGSFFTLVYTGFALKFPEAGLFAWLARLERGYAWRSQIHRWAAVALVGVSAGHVVYLFTRRGSRLLADLLPRPRDAYDAMQNGLYLVGARGAPPPFDRFGYIEKAEYWALVWGTVVMTATGVMLWFANLSLRWVEKWVLDLATLVHYYEAWLAFLAILVWHLYYVILNPDVYPMNLAWITGRISEDLLRHEHRGEWERLAARGETIEVGREPEADPGSEPGPGAATGADADEGRGVGSDSPDGGP